MFKVGLSPLTNRIYCGKSDRRTPNTLIGKEDVTSDALRAVFGWLVSYYEHAESGEEQRAQTCQRGQQGIETRVSRKERLMFLLR